MIYDIRENVALCILQFTQHSIPGVSAEIYVYGTPVRALHAGKWINHQVTRLTRIYGHYIHTVYSQTADILWRASLDYVQQILTVVNSDIVT